MKGFGRALEINCLFLLVVALLVVLQLILQGSQRELLLRLKERGGDGEAGGWYLLRSPPPSPLSLPGQDIHASDGAKAGIGEHGGSGGILAAPVVPNIRRSFPKRKAPYVRKAKNKKKKKNRKGKKQLGRGMGGAEGAVFKAGGIGDTEKSEAKVNKRGKTKVTEKTKIKV